MRYVIRSKVHNLFYSMKTAFLFGSIISQWRTLPLFFCVRAISFSISDIFSRIPILKKQSQNGKIKNNKVSDR